MSESTRERQRKVPLNKELEALKCYLKLQRAICSGQFDYRIDVYNVPDQKKILIPPMLLQPFAESAILHGFAGQKEKGLINININIKKDHKALHLHVE